MYKLTHYIPIAPGVRCSLFTKNYITNLPHYFQPIGPHADSPAGPRAVQSQYLWNLHKHTDKDDRVAEAAAHEHHNPVRVRHSESLIYLYKVRSSSIVLAIARARAHTS